VAPCGHQLTVAGIFETMQDQPITIGKVAKLIDVPASTARQYVKDFSHLDGVFSELAAPAPGQTRLFTDADIRVMWTIKVLRAQHRSTDDIADTLVAGERFYPEPGTRPGDRQAAQDDAGEAQSTDRVDSSNDAPINALVRFQDQVDNLTSMLLDAERARGEAETRAAVAERELEIMRKLLDQQDKKRWWRFWE
jgi:DNA-binding transcriptional MerR regulator